MAAKILDYKRPTKDSQRVLPYPSTSLQPMQPDMAKMVPLDQIHRQESGYIPPKSIFDYPAISDWLKTCENDLERGCDNHDYSALSPVFVTNGCTRIDDITRLTTEAIKAMADEQGISVTIGITNRVYAYAVEDVACVRVEGRAKF